MIVKCVCGKEFVLEEPDSDCPQWLLDCWRSMAKNTICEECHAKELRRREEIERIATERLRDEDMAQSGIPPRFRSWSRERGNLDLMRWVWENRDRNLYISGPVGSNKTWVACAAATKLESFVKIRFFRTVDLLRKIGAKYSRSCWEADEFITEVSACDLLILDDFGKEKITDRAGEALYSIIDARYSSDGLLWTTSNYSLDQLATRLGEDRGPAVARRLREMCLGWPNTEHSELVA